MNFFYPRLVSPAANGRNRTHANPLSLAGSITILPARHYAFALRRTSRPDHKGQKAACLQVAMEFGMQDPRSIAQVYSTDVNFSQIVCWVWSRDTVASITGHRDTRVMPEALARRGMERGVRIVQCIEGYEGELWLNKRRVAARWWPHVPDQTEWSIFLNGVRTLGLGGNAAEFLNAPKPQPEPARWKQFLFWTNPDWRSRIEQTPPAAAALGAAFLLLAPTGAEAMQLALTQRALSQKGAIVEELREKSAEWTALRRSAIEAAAFAELSGTAGDQMTLVFGLLDLKAALSERTSVSMIGFRDGEMTIQLQSLSGIDPAELVASLERSRSWQDVRIDPSKREIRGKLNFQAETVAQQTGGQANAPATD